MEVIRFITQVLRLHSVKKNKEQWIKAKLYTDNFWVTLRKRHGHLSMLAYSKSVYVLQDGETLGKAKLLSFTTEPIIKYSSCSNFQVFTLKKATKKFLLCGWARWKHFFWIFHTKTCETFSYHRDCKHHWWKSRASLQLANARNILSKMFYYGNHAPWKTYLIPIKITFITV